SSYLPSLFTFSLVFFFVLDAANWDLHSFPTRRSSDLADFQVLAAGREQRSERRGDFVVHHFETPGAEFPPYLIAGNSAPGVSKRSEEHTSELQSRGHLVCRLLLEKKKKIKLKKNMKSR